MAKKKARKKRKKVKKTKKKKRVTTKQLNLGALLEELDDAERELARIRRRLSSLRVLCRRIRVMKD